MRILFDNHGVTYDIKNGRDMLKALGQHTDRSLVMTNESGQVIGAGTDVRSMMRSQPLVKALRESRPLHKATPKVAVLAKKPETLRKSLSGFDKLIAELDRLQAAQKAFA